MSHVLKFILAALVAVSMSGRLHGQAAASSSASSVVATLPTPQPASPANSSQTANQRTTTNQRQNNQGNQPRYFREVYQLTLDLEFAGGSCFTGQLTFHATNATDVANRMASVPNFKLEAIPPDKIIIYSLTQWVGPVTPTQQTELTQLKSQLDELASFNFSAATAIRVLPGYANKSIAHLTLPSDGSISAKAVHTNCVLLVSKDQADPVVVASLKQATLEFYGQQPSAPPTQRLFYVDATALTKQLSQSSGPAKDSTGSATGKTPTPKPNTQAQAGAESSAVSGAATPTVSVSVASGGPTASPRPLTGSSDSTNPNEEDKSDQSNTQQSDSSNKQAGAKTSASDNSQGKTASAESYAPPTMQAVNDMLVFSNKDGGDSGILERNRLMVILDLPRPELLMNIWSLQASSKDYSSITAEAEAARGLIAEHNDILQRSVDQGWEELSKQMRKSDGKFFDPLFYGYVTQKFGETAFSIDPTRPMIDSSTKVATSSHPAQGATDVIASEGQGSAQAAESQRKESDNEMKIDRLRSHWGWCDSSKYCLGFAHAFEPLRPTLTNLIIGIAAATDAEATAETVIEEMEKGHAAVQPGCTALAPAEDPCQNSSLVTSYRACISKKIDRQLHTFQAQSPSCEIQDRITMSEQILNGQEESLQLNCFKKQARISFAGEVKSISDATLATTRVGLLRAAIADFLFDYKWAAQFPHDFVPYDLAQSAQELNAEFNPLVLAFNRDVAAFTENLQGELQCKYDANINRGTYINDGMLSVRGISGVESLVETVTQSFFDATNPPSLTDLAKSVSDAEKNTPGALKANLTADEAAVLLGALNSVQPATAKIGRELKLDIMPHSLPGASSAELEVKLTAQDTADPTRFTASKSVEDTLSRIAKHEVSTRVRVESLKLFDVSSFSAMLQRPRSKFPIIPPVFEVPYFGSFVGFPLSASKVYHRSTAVVSAVIVPTAADLAFGIDFAADRVCDEEGCHRARSVDEFGKLPLRNFHKAMIECFASGGSTAYVGLRQDFKVMVANPSCETLTFVEIPPRE